MRAMLAIALAACGSTTEPAPRPLPPNVAQACGRAIECGVFLAEQAAECLRCVEKLADLYDKELHGEIPPLKGIPCETIAKYAHDTLVSECVVRRSFGP